MNTPKWLFIVLVFWVGATLWCNALEPAQPDLLPASMSAVLGDPAVEGAGGLSDPSLVTTSGLTTLPGKVWDFAKNFWKALSFDYGIFTGWFIILRLICICFSIAGLYFIADMIYKIRSVILGG